MDRYIGGEFWYDSNIICRERQLDGNNAYFLSGGQASIQIICDYLNEHDIKSVLLPAYLCPTILDCFENNKIKWTFYKIKENFRIDLEDLRSKCINKKAIFFINYFGFSLTSKEKNIFIEMRNSGRVLIEDNVQCLFNKNPIGNFIFNSFRKFVAYDGCFLYSDYNLEKYLEKYKSRENSRLLIIRRARSMKKEFILSNKGSERYYLESFNQAEQEYYKGNQPISGDLDEKFSIEHLDWNSIIRKRRENYCYLVNKIKNIRDITILFPLLEEDQVPLGLPVYIKKEKRNKLKNDLKKNNIFLPIHWSLSTDKRFESNDREVIMSENILTLVIDQRYSFVDLDYLVDILHSCLGE